MSRIIRECLTFPHSDSHVLCRNLLLRHARSPPLSDEGAVSHWLSFVVVLGPILNKMEYSPIHNKNIFYTMV